MAETKDELPPVDQAAEWLVTNKPREAIKTMIEQADRINALLEALETIAAQHDPSLAETSRVNCMAAIARASLSSGRSGSGDGGMG